ncbi:MULTISPECIES: hypothetical protein [unclassified Caballeronia]|uniref:hypothetical protein n=1 Tax=unclassified Caballeronia TaxID=2646786 RepID=UPI00285BC05F|nr:MULTISPECIES: hypothetical protein [unclassified Caballeronia]MDR5753764.1 hypothetical protein [Caballeronia sp. LZ024]MDR5840143.1 hypothetical protein [Caballeronia sp. LZ031]
MNASPVVVMSTGLVTSVGHSAPATCAAIRAKLSNPSQTRFLDSEGDWIMAHPVRLERPWRERAKLARMGAMAIAECLDGIDRLEWAAIPLLLCVAEKERPGRPDGLDEHLLSDIAEVLGARFSRDSALVAKGRVSTAVAMLYARQFFDRKAAGLVVIAAVDSLLNWRTLKAFEREDRLLTSANSDGFMPGEAAGAVLVGATKRPGTLVCEGVGLGMERAHIGTESPLKGDGLKHAICAALADAKCALHDCAYCIASLSGEQYYFKETALALSRVEPYRKEDLILWHPAESVGETATTVGVIAIAVADSASKKHYGPGGTILYHASNDQGERAAMVLRYYGEWP